MLKILKNKRSNSFNNVKINKNSHNTFYKKMEPMVRSWKNSIYTYRKNILSLIPAASNLTTDLINGYFNLYNLKLLKKLNKRLHRKMRKNLNYRRFFTNKIFLSEGQFKHTNDMVNITIFFYNRQLSNYKKKLTRRFRLLFKRVLIYKIFKFIKNKSYVFMKEQNRKQNYYLKYIKFNNLLPIYNMDQYKKWYFRKLLKKTYYKFRLYMYFRKLIFINVNKFNNYYLQNLTNLIKKIYKKNVLFNFINVKYFYFNSDILTQSLTLKIRKNRRKVSRFLKLFVIKSKIKEINYNPIVKHNWNIKSLNISKNIDITNALLYDILFQNESYSLKNIIMNNINNKRVSGVRIHLGGRLTRRNTASRSISKNRIKGSLSNLSSSKYGYSSSLLRGTLKSNLDYTNINSYIRNGSFGVKGWISGI